MHVDRAAERHNPDEFHRATKDWSPTERVLLHRCHDVIATLFVEDRDEAGRHRIAHVSLARVGIVGDGLHRDVAIGEHADNAPVFEDSNHADIV